jgi:hypothetical protein
MLTEEILKNSQEFKDWVTGSFLIHNLFDDVYPTYIVVHSDSNKDNWTITRFFLMGGKIQVSNDHVDISTEETFKLLLLIQKNANS